jgi:protein-ribulosamine 3-kinase
MLLQVKFPFSSILRNTVSRLHPELPEGSKVTPITPHGSSFWTQTAHLETTLADGTPKSYFLKVALDEQGRRMMNGELESISSLYAIIPDFVPKPYTWGSYKTYPEMHFFLCDFQSVSPTSSLKV